MTIEKGQAWGTTVARPEPLRIVDNDAALADAVRAGVAAGPSAGDLHKTVGGRPLDGRAEVLKLPIDLLHVTLDHGVEHHACAHVTAQNPLRRGGWWRGPVLMVMNAEFLGDWHIVARGHPNDGRAESCEWGSSFGVRKRVEARRRLPMGAHVPHPDIETRSFRRREWTFQHPLVITVDGEPVGTSASLAIEVLPDAGEIYA